MFLNLLKILVVAVAVMLSGCAVMVVGIETAITEGESDKLSGAVEVGEVKMKAGANVALLKTAKLSSAVFEKDMVTPNASPAPADVEVHTAVTEEIKRSLGVVGNTASPTTARLKTAFFKGGSISGFYYYRDNTERKTLSYMQRNGVRKAVNTHFVLEQGGDTLLEVHGLWVAGSQGDEIAGARQLAKEMASAVLKKLKSPAPRSAATETKKE